MITKAFSHDAFGDFTCFGCGRRFEQNHACIAVLPRGKTELKDSCGDLCPGCVLNGPEMLSETFTKWATLEDLAKAQLKVSGYFYLRDNGNLSTEALQSYITEHLPGELEDLRNLAEEMKDYKPAFFMIREVA